MRLHCLQIPAVILSTPFFSYLAEHCLTSSLWWGQAPEGAERQILGQERAGDGWRGARYLYVEADRVADWVAWRLSRGRQAERLGRCFVKKLSIFFSLKWQYERTWTACIRKMTHTQRLLETQEVGAPWVDKKNPYPWPFSPRYQHTNTKNEQVYQAVDWKRGGTWAKERDQSYLRDS